MMRELVESRSFVAVLLGLYVLATLGAIPVPAFVLSRAPTIDEIHASYCSCVSCSPTNCCCAMLAPSEGAPEGTIAMLGYSCQPTVTWFLAILPPAAEGAALSGVDAGPMIEQRWPMLAGAATRAIGVPTPPPKRGA